MRESRMVIRAVAVLAFGLGIGGTSGCHVGLMGVYGFTGEQRENGMVVACPKCGGTDIDRMRFAPPEPITGTILPNVWIHDWYCPGCGTWWRTRGWNQYRRGPNWPWSE